MKTIQNPESERDAVRSQADYINLVEVECLDVDAGVNAIRVSESMIRSRIRMRMEDEDEDEDGGEERETCYCTVVLMSTLCMHNYTTR